MNAANNCEQLPVLTSDEKAKLADVLAFDCETSNFESCRVKQLDQNEFSIDQIQVHNFGRISVPVSSRVIFTYDALT